MVLPQQYVEIHLWSSQEIPTTPFLLETLHSKDFPWGSNNLCVSTQSHEKLLVSPAPFVEEAVSSPMCALASFSSQRTVVVWMYIGSSVLSHWSACPFCALLCQCHAVFITMALSYSWNQVLGCLQEYSYCSELLWISQVLCASIRILSFFFLFL